MKPRDITITTVLNGWLVRIGCQTVVFSDLDSLLGEVGLYLTYPDATQERYKREAVNAEFFALPEDGHEVLFAVDTQLGQLGEEREEEPGARVRAINDTLNEAVERTERR